MLQIFNFILFFCMHAAHFLFSCKLTIIWSMEKTHERSEKAVKKRREMERIQLVLKVRQTSSFKLSEIYTHTCTFKREVFNSFQQKIMIHKNAFNLSRSLDCHVKSSFEGDRGRNGMEKNEHTMFVMAQLRRWKK